MNNIVIGVVARDEEIDTVKYQAITKNNLKYLHNNCSYIGIINYDNNSFIYDEVLKLCDGIIIQGGNKIYPYHFQILNYAMKNNIPLLGICMGHQIIGLFSNNEDEDDLILVDNHYGKEKRHMIYIKDNSRLKQLFGSFKLVNSRHYYKVSKVSSPFKITAESLDNVIEAIEYIDNDHYILGVQFHPEDMNNTKILFDDFINEVKERKKDKSV